MSFISSLFTAEGLKQLILWIPVILFSISFHEFAHGWVAYKLGDPTAKNAGRLTLNPIKHFNPFGFLMMLIVHFGWATPVPVDPANFKKPRQGMLYTAVAGPIANIILALISSLLYAILYVSLENVTAASSFAISLIRYTALLLLYFIYMNIGLAVFNLIPVYPLDGSRILEFFMPYKYQTFMMKYGQYIQLAFMLIVILTSVVGTVIGTVQSVVANVFVDVWIALIKFFVNIF